MVLPVGLTRIFRTVGAFLANRRPAWEGRRRAPGERQRLLALKAEAAFGYRQGQTGAISSSEKRSDYGTGWPRLANGSRNFAVASRNPVPSDESR